LTVYACFVSGSFLYSVLDLWHDFRHGLPFRNPNAWPLPVYVVILSVVSLICFVLVWFAIRTFKNNMKQVKNLAYVASITSDTLPAEEILVRGSEEPSVALNEVLLRAAKEQETPKEELLRASGK
jgi:hypothetical protein